MLDTAKRLHQQISTVAPIFGVSLPDASDPATWRIDFKPEATPEQQAAAQAVIDGWDFATAEKLTQRARVIEAAAAARYRYLTRDKDLTYTQKQTEAQHWIDAGQPANPSQSTYPYAARRAGRLGVSIAEVLLEWHGIKLFFRQIDLNIEDAYETGIETIQNAATAEGAIAAGDAAVGALGVI
jgi:hypothetical protein